VIASSLVTRLIMDLKRAKEILNNNSENPLSDNEVRNVLSFLSSYAQVLLQNLLKESS
jgi:hypothetical protein